MNRNGLLVGLLLWIIITVILVFIGFIIVSNNKVFSYVCYSLITLSFSTCIIIGMYLLNKNNLILQKLLKIDTIWLFVGILFTVFEILQGKYHSYNMYLPLTIYMIRLMTIYANTETIYTNMDKKIMDKKQEKQ